ncbi:hypothetical protein RHGRI_021714 [Rhododendron griersonianum]|uniref:Uncharacterized protein n=1 Tax=Rhododendron griersonianum TaxID=479676 RepID=A0AAV6JN05_9ERIC|nr:hypothetical protein RHGRI_021714 [Rhododendron griersonianum]
MLISCNLYGLNLFVLLTDSSLYPNQMQPGNLKRCVRDVLSRKRMVAFLLLDSSQESMMDIPVSPYLLGFSVFTFPLLYTNNPILLFGGKMKVTKGLDSFPFPYYIVLRNIEALPRTLADLMRQWFELMQNSRD